MLSAAQLKKFQSLKLKKYRQKYGEFLIEGDKLVLEALNGKAGLQHIVATEEWQAEYRGEIPAGVSVITALPHQIARISAMSTAPPVLAVMKIPDPEVPQEGDAGWIIALDGIRDPGNLGTILRTAEWFGIQHILCSEDCADCYNSKAVQASMGAILRMPVIYIPLLETLTALKLPVFAACLNGTPLQEITLPQSGVLLIGSESHGIDKSLLQISDCRVTIPRRGKGESLNAAVACGIILSAIYR